MMKRTQKENEQHNNAPLITEGRYYPHALSLKFSWLNSGATKKTSTQAKQSTPQQTPTEQREQHILNINYLCSLFNNARI